MQTGRIWRCCADETRRPGLWGLPGTRLQTCRQRAVWSRCPRDHIQKPQVNHKGSCWSTVLHWCPNRLFFFFNFWKWEWKKSEGLKQQTGGVGVIYVFPIIFSKVALFFLIVFSLYDKCVCTHFNKLPYFFIFLIYLSGTEISKKWP